MAIGLRHRFGGCFNFGFVRIEGKVGLASIRTQDHYYPDIACTLVSYHPEISAFEELGMDSTGGCPGMFFSETSGELRELSFFRAMEEYVFENKTAGMQFRNMLESIGRIMGLNKSQLAAACGLRTRKALYAWGTGAVPRKNSMKRLHLLYRAALDWERSGFMQPEKALHLPVVQGKSLFDLLKEDPLDLEAIHFAGARLSNV